MKHDTAQPVSYAEVDAATTARLLRAASARLEQVVAAALEPFGLTAAQFEVLAVLAESEALALGCSEIGKRLTSRASDITRLLDRLESVALVTRNRDESDRRVVHTKLTGKGQELVRRATPQIRAAEQRALGSLSSTDQARLTQLLSNAQEPQTGA